MEKIIIDGKLRKVIYDTEKKTYTKTIKCKLKKRIKFYLHLRRYPGENIKYIADLFHKNGINTFEVLSYSKYEVVMSEIEGKTLLEEIITNKDKERSEKLIYKYLDLVTRIIELGVYFGDFNFGNFIVHNDELYAIDLEDYRKDFLTRFRRKPLMKRLKRDLKRQEKTLLGINEYLNGENLYREVEERLEKN